MPSPSSVWQFTCEFVRAFFAEAKQAIAPSYSIEIVEQDEVNLVLRSSGQLIAINKRYRTVKNGSSVLALFDAIQSIDITHREGDDEPETWTVSLNLNWRASVRVGRSTDATDASIAAARIATFTGKKVRAL